MSGETRHQEDAPLRKYRLARPMRLRRGADFEAVYAARHNHHAGPLMICAKPNKHSHLRLGLSLPRRVGNAVNRNRIKRRLREAFRLMQHDLPSGYDLVVNVRPHDPLPLAEYQRVLSRAMRHLHLSWSTNDENDPSKAPEKSDD